MLSTVVLGLLLTRFGVHVAGSVGVHVSNISERRITTVTTKNNNKSGLKICSFNTVS